MSIILKGIDLPKDIDELRLIINGMSIAIEPTQAIQIPTPHGRLIDAKLLADTINKAIQDGTFTSKSIWEWIGDAPTILESEE